MAGTTALEYADRPMFDIIQCANNIAADMAESPFHSAADYVMDMCNDLADRIDTANLNIALPERAGRDFLTGMFVGYFQDKPVRLQVGFKVDRARLQSPELLELVEAPENFCIASGSQVVWDELVNDVYQPETLAEAERFIRTYLSRCIENETDPYCAEIGGCIQVASVTPHRFSWLTSP